MKSSYGIYYLFIIFLIFMIAVPPLLRFAIPNENKITDNNNKTNKEETSNNINDTEKEKNLLCKINNNNSFTIVTATDYLNSKPILLEITYNFYEYEANSTYNSNPLFTVIEELKKIPNAEVIETEKGNSITFDFNNKVDIENNSIQNFVQDIDAQKTYYENLGFICSIN